MPDIFDQISPEKTDIFDVVAAGDLRPEEYPQEAEERAQGFVDKYSGGIYTGTEEEVEYDLGKSLERLKELRPFVNKEDITKAEESVKYAATFGVKPSTIYNLHDEFKAKMKPGKMFMSGIGDVYDMAGSALEWMGFDEQARIYGDFGRRVKHAYSYPLMEREITWENLREPAFLANTIIRSVPFTLSLIPAAIVSAYGSASVGGAVGLGTLGKTILGAIGAASVSRPLESALEAGGVYQEALAKGLSEEAASRAASDTFKGNMALTGLDAAQFVAAFTPLRILGDTASKVRIIRSAAVGGKLIGIGASEAGEEIYQGIISKKALGEDIKLSPEMATEGMVGFIFGAGLGGAGSVYTALRSRIVDTMPEELSQSFNETKQQFINEGMSDETADLKALDEIANTPEGKEHIEQVVNDLKEGKEFTPKDEVSTSSEPVDEVDSAIDEMIAESDEEAPESVSEGKAIGFTPEAEKAAPEPIAEASGAKEPWETSDLATKPNIGIDSVQAQKQANGKYRLFYRGTRNEVFQGEIFNSANEARQFFKAQQAKAQATDLAEARLPEKSLLEEAKKYKTAEEFVEGQTKGVFSERVVTKEHAQAAVSKELSDSEYADIKRMTTPFENGDELWYHGYSSKEFLDADIKAGKMIPPPHAGEGVYLTKDYKYALAYAKNNPDLVVEVMVPKKYNDRLELWGDEPLTASFTKHQEPLGSVEIKSIKVATSRPEPVSERTYKSSEEFWKVHDKLKSPKSQLTDIWNEAHKGKVRPDRTLMRDINRVTGVTAIRDMIRQDDTINTAFNKALRLAKKAYREGNKEGIAEQKKVMRDIIDNMKKEQSIKKIIESIKQVSKSIKKSSINVTQKKQIIDLIDDIDFTKQSEKGKKAIQGYLENHGVDLYTDKKKLKEIKRLSKTPIRDLSNDEIEALNQTIKKLKAEGRLIAKLKNLANEREKSENLKRLIESTNDIDRAGHETRYQKGKTGRSQKVRNDFSDALKTFYIETLHTFRVADMLDGFKNYSGENARLIKQLLLNEQNFNEVSQKRISALLDEIQDILGDTELSEDQLAIIMTHIRYDEGAYDAVNALNTFYDLGLDGQVIQTKQDLNSALPLSDVEQKLIEVLRKHVPSKTDDIEVLHERLSNEPFIRVKNYTLPLVYERGADIDPSMLVQQEFNDIDNKGNIIRRTKKTKQGFVIERIQGVKKVPRIDIFSIAEEAITAQEWYLNMQPPLLDIASLVFDKQYQEVAGITASNWWKDQVDIVARRGWKESYRSTGFGRGMRRVRTNLNNGVLLYKATTILMQPFAVFDAIAYVNAKYGTSAVSEIAKEFMNVWLSPKYAKEMIDASQAVSQRKGGEVSMEEIYAEASKSNKLFSKLEKGGFNLIQKTDITTAAGVRKGVLNILKKEGVENAEQEADFIMHLTQGSSNITLRPHVLASGEGSRTIFTFATFFLNRWGVLVHDILKSGFRGDWKAKLTALMSLGIMMIGGMAEDEARRQIARFFKGKKQKERDRFMDTLWYLPEQIPAVGNIISSARMGFGSEIPAIGVGKRGLSGLVNITKGNYEKGALQASKAALILILGIPGTTQFYDIFERLVE